MSAIVTSYNHERYVGRAVESALAQDVDGLEVIVVDDASRDGTHRLLDRFAGDPRLRVEIHPENRGISPTFNHGLALAQGEFAAFLGSDDYWLPGHLRGGVEALRESDAAMCYSRARVVDGEDRDVTEAEDLFGSAPDEDVFASLLDQSNFIPFISVVMRRDVAVRAGGFDERFVTLMDYDLWLRIASEHPVRFLDRATAAFRWDGANASRRSIENSILIRRELALVLESWLADRGKTVRRIGGTARLRRRLAGNYRRLGHRMKDPAERARCYRESLRHDPRRPGTWARFLASRVRASVAMQRSANGPV